MSFPGGVLVVSPAVGLSLAAGAWSKPAAAVGLGILFSIAVICLLAGEFQRLKEERHGSAHGP